MHLNQSLVKQRCMTTAAAPPITSLPFLEHMLWQETWVAELEGDHGLSMEHAADLLSFGYQVIWEDDGVTLHHRYTGQEMHLPTVGADAWRVTVFS